MKIVKKSVKNSETILPFSCCPLTFFSEMHWEVLNAVGVDGVWRNFALVFVLLFSSLFFVFLLVLLGQGQPTAIYWKKGGNFTPTPSAPTLFRTS